MVEMGSRWWGVANIWEQNVAWTGEQVGGGAWEGGIRPGRRVVRPNRGPEGKNRPHGGNEAALKHTKSGR